MGFDSAEKMESTHDGKNAGDNDCLSLVVIFDNSFYTDSKTNGKNDFEEEQKAAKAIFGLMPGDVNIGLVPYHAPGLDIKDAGMHGTVKPAVPLGQYNRRLLCGKVNMCVPAGERPLICALGQAYSQLDNKAGLKEIVLITNDNEAQVQPVDTCGQSERGNPDSVFKQIDIEGKHIPIRILNVSGASHRYRGCMPIGVRREFAELSTRSNGGVYAANDTESAVGDLIHDIRKDIEEQRHVHGEVLGTSENNQPADEVSDER